MRPTTTFALHSWYVKSPPLSPLSLSETSTCSRGGLSMDINCKISGQSIVLHYCNTNKACEITCFLQFTHLMCTKVTCVPFSAAARIHIERALVILMGTADAHQHHQNTTRSLPDNPGHLFACLSTLICFGGQIWNPLKSNLCCTQAGLQMTLKQGREQQNHEGRMLTMRRVK